MTIRKTAGTVGTLAQGAVSTAVNAARHPIGTASTAVGLAKHPIGTASMAVGLAKGVAGAGVDLVRGGRTDVHGPEATFVAEQAASPRASARETLPRRPRRPARRAARARTSPSSSRRSPEDLPEPIVIEADDHPTPGDGEAEAFHNEPKPASRDVAHGGPGTDFEEAEGFVEEIPADLRPE